MPRSPAEMVPNGERINRNISKANTRTARKRVLWPRSNRTEFKISGMYRFLRRKGYTTLSTKDSCSLVTSGRCVGFGLKIMPTLFFGIQGSAHANCTLAHDDPHG